MPLQPESRLGPYQFLAPLGAGGMGEVHRARHVKLGREVAIKVLPASVVDEPERLASTTTPSPTTGLQPAHFAPRIETPTLMINGRDDFLVPYEASQRPLFELIGTDPEHKRHARLPGGHIPSDPRDIMREVLDWLDRYFGPVGASQPPSRPPAG